MEYNENKKPKGLEHQNRNFASLKVDHFIIKAHQEAFPELVKEMSKDPDNATNIYTAFISLLLLKINNRLTSELRVKIMKRYGLLEE